MKKYEILEHKADLEIRVFGKTKEELFLSAVLAVTKSMDAEIQKPEEKVKRMIQVHSLDLPMLFVDFLSDILYQSQINQEVYDNVKFSKLTNTELEAEIFGRKIVKFGEDIKAATYHDLEVKNNKNGWEAVVLFDI